MSEKSVIAIVSGDWHLSESPPVVRSVEPDWLAVQAGYLKQLKTLQQDLRGVPILVAGDLFDRWNSLAHLINHALSWLKGMKVYAIPGNHDLPNHNHDQLRRSAYWTLVEAGVIIDMQPSLSYNAGLFTCWPFPHGFKVTPPNRGSDVAIHVALIHDYIWTKDTGHAEAPEDKRLGAWLRRLQGYDVAVFGDNHKSILKVSREKLAPYHPITVFNCGSLMRRTTDERDYKPCVGLLHADGTIKRHHLDTSKDRFIDLDDSVTKQLEKGLEIDLAGLTEELSRLHMEKLDFAKLVLRLCEKHKVPAEVRTVILRCLGATK